ncbi:MAG: wax ester/triacylglycerol synthase domain-containing protein [Ilumatobacteraceae bacterium]
MADHEKRMSDTESLMWRLEKDPYLASTFGNITILDRPPNMDVLYARMERTALLFPRLRRRVLPAPGNLGNPTWVDDPTFDIRYHVRHISLAEPGDMRQLLDLVTLLVADPFDRSRPLWHFIVVDGLHGGRSALVQKLHHTVTDGQGGVELSMHYLDLERDPGPLPPIDPDLVNAATDISGPDATEALRGAMSDSLRLPLSVLRQVRDVLSDPSLIGTIGSSTSATVKSLMAQLSDTDGARSPLWTQRSLRRRLDTARVSYHDMRGASKALGGTLNTAFVTAAAHAAGKYHRALGAPVESLRASMAISTRTEDSGSNAFTLARMLVPTAEMPLPERFLAVNEILHAARSGSSNGSLEAIATVSTLLPTSVITRLARAQAETVDFATSNVRGAGVPLFVAGSKLLENYPVGPLGGVAFNLTLMSYMGSLDVGINIDEAAIESPSLLRDSLVESLTELASYAPTSESTTSDYEVVPTKRRWWKRSR